jgi:hypothetical protein
MCSGQNGTEESFSPTALAFLCQLSFHQCIPLIMWGVWQVWPAAYLKFCSQLGPSGICLFSEWGNICEIWGSDGCDYDVEVFWDVIPWSSVDTNFSGEYVAATNKAEEWEASSSRMLANMYHTIKCHIPEDSNLKDILFIAYIQKVYIFSSKASWFCWIYLMTHSKAKLESCINKPFHFSGEMKEKCLLTWNLFYVSVSPQTVFCLIS